MKTRSLLIVGGGLVLLFVIAVFLNSSSNAGLSSVTQVAPETQTAGFFGNIAKAFKSVVKAVTNVVKSVGNAIKDLTCQVFTDPIQNVFGSCGGGGSGTTANTGGTGTGDVSPPSNTPAPGGQQQGAQTPGGGTVQGGAPQACNSAPNACGMTNVGFIQGGQCNATTPPLSACPAPIIGTTGFYAEPARVKSGTPSTLHWNVTNATVCSITGGGLSFAGLGVSGQKPTNSITQQTTFTLTCQNGAVGSPSNQASAVVNIIPTYQEI